MPAGFKSGFLFQQRYTYFVNAPGIHGGLVNHDRLVALVASVVPVGRSEVTMLNLLGVSAFEGLGDEPAGVNEIG